MRRLCTWLVVLAVAFGSLCQAAMATELADQCAPQLTAGGPPDHHAGDHPGTMQEQGHKACCPHGCLPGSLVPPELGGHVLAWHLAELGPAGPSGRPGLLPSCPLRPPNPALPG